MESKCSSDMSAGFQRTTQRYIPEGRTVQNDRRQNLKSDKINCVLSMNFIVYVLH
jgi:hypothetical protein